MIIFKLKDQEAWFAGFNKADRVIVTANKHRAFPVAKEHWNNVFKRIKKCNYNPIPYQITITKFHG
jgi:hypothetical protein